LSVAPDYHIHSSFSCDGKSGMAAICQAAASAGIAEIAFTEHADFEPQDECCGRLDVEAYLREIERCRALLGDRLTIRAGLEVGEPHIYGEEVAAILAAHQFDLVLGSLHWLQGKLVLEADFFAHRTLEDGLRAYFSELHELVASADFDVLAHFDVVRRGAYRAFGPIQLDYAAHEGVIRSILGQLVAPGKVLEVNSSGCWRGPGGLHP
jgi:histidinol-phosphatase (PHP family)